MKKIVITLEMVFFFNASFFREVVTAAISAYLMPIMILPSPFMQTWDQQWLMSPS